MSDSLEDDFSQRENPEGFPCCPKCGDYVVTCSERFDNDDMEHYYCDSCRYTFPLEDAKE